MDIGKKLKGLRILKGLTQEELADRSELSKGFISQVERNLTSPSISTLMDILQCLGTDLKEFFSDSEDSQIVFKKTDYFEKTDTELHNVIQWIIPNAQKNIMEAVLLIRIILMREKSLDIYYRAVLKFTLEIRLSKQKAENLSTSSQNISILYPRRKAHSSSG